MHYSQNEKMEIIRLVEQSDLGVIRTPSFRIMSASDSFQDKTTSVNQMWQTDFTYFKIVGWGWYYLSTILDDYSRFIVNWKFVCHYEGRGCKTDLG